MAKREPAIDSRLDAVFEAVLSPLLVLDRDLRVVTANPAYCSVAGRSLEDLVGRNVLQLFPDAPERDGEGPNQLGLSLETVITSGSPDTMPLQR